MRVGNFHEPQTGLDVTRIPTERQTQTLRRHSDTIPSLRFRYVDDGGGDEKEAPDNTTSDDEDDHTDEKKIPNVFFQLRSPRTSTKSPTTTHTTPTASRKDDTTEANPQDLNEQEESSHDAGSKPLLRRRTRRRAGAMGPLSGASNAQSRRPVGCKWNHVVASQSEQNIGNKQEWIAKDHKERWPKFIFNWKSGKSMGIGSQEHQPRD